MNDSSSIFSIIAVIYLLVTGIFVLFSVFGIYILIRYGKSQKITLAISVIYSVVFLIVLSRSYYILQSLK